MYCTYGETRARPYKTIKEFAVLNYFHGDEVCVQSTLVDSEAIKKAEKAEKKGGAKQGELGI